MQYVTTGFTAAENSFMQTVLDDPRAWNFSFRRVSQKEKHLIAVHKLPQSAIDAKYKDYPHLHGLSVCDRTGDITQIYLSQENWNSPPSVSNYTTKSLYRTYLILHEFGHALGHGHSTCPGARQPAPVMMQQTKGTGLCYPDPWVRKAV